MMKPKKPPDDKNHPAEKEVTELTDYEMLRNLHSKIEKLVADEVTASSPEFKVWKNQVERLIVKHCGAESIEYTQFHKIRFSPLMLSNVMNNVDFKEICKNGLETVKGMLDDFLEEWEEETTVYYNNKKCFIVHGHDEALKHQVARILERQGIEAVILSEQANVGKTIIEKIEKHSDVGAAILLFTPDDSGKANAEPDYKPRARQNVVFEAGFFMGKLGRDRVIMLVTDHTLELPSDLHGVVYASDNNLEFSLIREMKVMGFDVDMNKVKF